MRLSNKVIIVTGSTTGIGKAIATACVREGARVVIHGLEKDWGEEAVAGLGNDKAILHIEDITMEGAAQRLVDLALKTFGRLDAVVNNAAAVVSSAVSYPSSPKPLQSVADTMVANVGYRHVYGHSGVLYAL